MSIEKVKMLKTVQAGRECWEKGTILPIGGESLHPIILQEIIQRTGTVEVLSYKEDPIKKGSKLKTPLDNNSLLEAQRKERELNERLNAERVKAEEAVLMSKKFAKDFQETKEVLEGMSDGELFYAWEEFVFQDEDFLAARTKFTEDFYDYFLKGYEYYVYGDWNNAKVEFERANVRITALILILLQEEVAKDKINVKKNEGPCKGLLEYMQQSMFVAPRDWNGFRPASSGGGH